jgi:hypothetical protein
MDQSSMYLLGNSWSICSVLKIQQLAFEVTQVHPLHVKLRNSSRIKGNLMKIFGVVLPYVSFFTGILV